MFKIGLIFCICFSAALVAGLKKEPVIQQPVDQTDIFAIPFDDDEQAQDEELQELEHPKK